MQGLYGEAQGNENRAVERSAAVALLSERIAENAISEGEAVAELVVWWDTALWDSFDTAYDAMRKQGLELGENWFENGKTDKGYKAWRSRYITRLQSIITRATFGLPVAIKVQGDKFSDGAFIPSPNAPKQQTRRPLDDLLAQ